MQFAHEVPATMSHDWIFSEANYLHLQVMQLVWGERVQDPMQTSTCWTKRVLHSHIVFVALCDSQVWLGFNHLKRCELIRKCVWEQEEHEVNLRELFRLHQQGCCASMSTMNTSVFADMCQYALSCDREAYSSSAVTSQLQAMSAWSSLDNRTNSDW